MKESLAPSGSHAQALDSSWGTKILELTKAIHAMNSARSPTGSNGTEQAASGSIRNAVGQ